MWCPESDQELASNKQLKATLAHSQLATRNDFRKTYLILLRCKRTQKRNVCFVCTTSVPDFLISVTKTLPVRSYRTPYKIPLQTYCTKNYYHELSLGGTTTTGLDLVLCEHDRTFVSLLQLLPQTKVQEKI